MPRKSFHYLYAVLHSPAYRQRYAAFLRTDFPRIPIPGSRAVFDALASLGAQLVAMAFAGASGCHKNRCR
jgi:predicted helicase